MKQSFTVRELVQKTLTTMTAAQHEIVLFVLHKEHRIKAGQEINEKNLLRINHAVKQVLGDRAER